MTFPRTQSKWQSRAGSGWSQLSACFLKPIASVCVHNRSQTLVLGSLCVSPWLFIPLRALPSTGRDGLHARLQFRALGVLVYIFILKMGVERSSLQAKGGMWSNPVERVGQTTGSVSMAKTGVAE